MMLVTEYMTGSVGDYIRNTKTFSDATFEIMKNVYKCWKHMASGVLKHKFKENPKHIARVADIILGIVEYPFQSPKLWMHLGKPTTVAIKCNAVGECANDAAFMCGITYKTYYCKKHKPTL